MEVRVLAVNAPVVHADVGRYKVRVVGHFKSVPPVVHADVIVYRNVVVPEIFKSVKWMNDGKDYLRIVRKFIGDFRVVGISVTKETVLETAVKVEKGRVVEVSEEDIFSSVERALLTVAGMFTRYLFLETPRGFIARGEVKLAGQLTEVFIYGLGRVDNPHFFIWLAEELAKFLSPIRTSARSIQNALNIVLRQIIGFSDILFLERMP